MSVFIHDLNVALILRLSEDTSLLTEDTYPPAEDTLPSERRHLRDRQTLLSGDDTMLSLPGIAATRQVRTAATDNKGHPL